MDYEKAKSPLCAVIKRIVISLGNDYERTESV